MFSNEKEDSNVIIFNTPKNLNLRNLFSSYTEEKLNKVRYIVHQCNYYSNKYGYNYDLSNHRWFLSLTRNDLIYIKNVLVEGSVIKQTVKGSKGNRSDHYSIVTPFNYLKEETVNKHFFDLNSPDCPLWVQRYVADDYAVKNTETTKWIKGSETVKPVKADNREEYIKLLELTLISNNIELPVLVSAPVKEPELKSGLNMTEGHSKPLEVKTPEIIIPVDKTLSKDKQALQLLAGVRDKVKSTPAPEEPKLIKVQPVAAKEVIEITKEIIETTGDDITIINYPKYAAAIAKLKESEVADIVTTIKKALVDKKINMLNIPIGYQLFRFYINAENDIVSFTSVERRLAVA